ncbi:MAG TPA: LacI family DNA-binding transcriptional regulator [Anaerolineales bacterium]|nr:LacI family DNA-binding transcriptional regulator [Anaerolineales bacterium]
MTKRPTQIDVARLAGVSRATVSYVLNRQTDGRVPISEATYERVTRAIAELGYEPDARAQALRSGNTHTIGVIIPDLRNPHFCEYATGIEQAARAAGYHMLLSSTALNADYGVGILEDLARRRIDGLILATSFILKAPAAQKTLARLRERSLPIVELSDQYDVDCIASDYREATREMIAYLLGLGHKRIGFISGVDGAPEAGDDRFEPFHDMLRAAGLLDPKLIMNCGPTIEDGYQAALELLRRADRPTAVLAINDLLAISVLRAAYDLGLRVPDDLSLAAFDDIPMARYLTPRLTTVSKDALWIGQEAFRLLHTRIQTPELPRQRVVGPAKLIIRESTGPAPT